MLDIILSVTIYFFKKSLIWVGQKEVEGHNCGSESKRHTKLRIPMLGKGHKKRGKNLRRRSDPTQNTLKRVTCVKTRDVSNDRLVDPD